MLIPATWVECMFRKAPCRYESFKDSAQGPFKFLTRCLHLDKYINPNLDLLIDQGLLRTGLPGACPRAAAAAAAASSGLRTDYKVTSCHTD